MSRAFSVMKTNVGNSVQDTSSAFMTKIGVYINKRYKQILRRTNWEYINEDYTITTISGTQDYTLPTDFKTEMYAVDTTNNINLKRITLQDIAKENTDSLSSNGSVSGYVIFNSDSGDKILRLFEIPTGVYTIAFPYIVTPVDLSADADENVLDIEDLIEIGATADAWRYKRQFAKGAAMETLFEKEMEEYIWANSNQQNKITQFKPMTFNKNNLY